LVFLFVKTRIQLFLLNLDFTNYHTLLSDPAKEREKFTIGYDGMGINLCWLRWEEALKGLPQDILGGFRNREGTDNPHAEPSGILFAVEEWKYDVARNICSYTGRKSDLLHHK
jgi:hypothetical protein